ncbi:Ger(x)C family germination protein [Cytobacillus firmus]|uniref:Ger(X)C family germination protein n=3 Tax=Bacillaceae TaxID=186817 RepID=A0A366JMA5_CYTFI|nr:Ger(x)C family germination protein [Cytobacillus firmus]TDX38320.1 Ger(x)C family germination protein [Cytobacillus oceanisediminis]
MKNYTNGITFDTSEDEPDMLQTSVRALNIQGSGGGKFTIKDEMAKSKGKNVIEIDINYTNKIPGELDLSKAYVIVIGEELAKSKGILPLLEPIGRSRYGDITSKVMIAEGRGTDILSIQMENSPLAFRLLKMFGNAEERTHIPKENTFSIWNKITDHEDSIIPLVRKSGPNQIEISGTALFNGDKYTGYSLSPEQSTLLLIMDNRFNKLNFFNIDHDNKEMNPFAIIINRIKHQTNLKLDEDNKDGEIVFEVDIKLDAEINYYEGIISNNDIKKFNRLASDYLTDQANKVTNILIDAESDVLGIQKEISVQYPQYLNNKEWKNVYSKIQIKPNFSVEITGTQNIK